ncbi:adenylate kinase [Ornatilinea apprima]|uniref:Adenylate kinase n=1 Tax=Ornatilinea apprima TaxID=1134406 RepID=A0A0P6X411_9CHLR|nr:adenylate kinase [Ornatilinea apprima]KPL76147.1 adenylate kinase [Ornatilinea apprima]
MYVVLLGPPGAGKGTQAQAISQELKLAHISSGDIFRENLKKETELGKLAKGYMDRGELVPDDVTISMIEERLSRPDCAEGALLDGFPRTPAQAEALSVMLAKQGKQIDVVPLITVPAEVLVERLSGRWTCPTCGYVYHSVFNPPKQTGVCDTDGAALYQREDDKPETVKNRIRVYESQTAPLIEYYQKRNLLAEVDGTLPIEHVTQSLLEVIKKVG